jgi:hypothetical protein
MIPETIADKYEAQPSLAYTGRTGGKDRSTVSWRRDFHSALFDDISDTADQLEDLRKLGDIARAARIALTVALTEASGKEPVAVANLMLARVPSLLTTLELIERAGRRASSTLAQCEAAADGE